MILLDGKALAEKMDGEFTARVQILRANGVVPKLVVIMVGNNHASETYIHMKAKRCKRLNIESQTIQLPETTTQFELLSYIERLNLDKSVTGILTQLPLPKHIDEQAILEAINPIKDVDCFHPYNVGKLSVGSPVFLPATPAGIIILLEHYGAQLSGKRAVVIGRSNIVGKPVSMLLMSKNCTVTVCHSKTVDLPSIVCEGDIVVAAVGKAKLVKGNWIKQGVWIVDVGTNKLPDGSQCGDVDFEDVKDKAAAISPVPGGVGPMTITMLMDNTIKAAELITKNK